MSDSYVPGPENSATLAARAVIAGLISAGVKHLVLCPGSRNAPLVYAAAQAEEQGLLRLHVRLDERSAAFFAVGLARGEAFLARVTEDRRADFSDYVFTEPVALAVTSGTAVAELHAGVLEAAHQGIPLIVLTADRPPQLRGTGTNQTTLQPGIFGAACEQYLDIDTAQCNEVADLQRLTVQAVTAALGNTRPLEKFLLTESDIDTNTTSSDSSTSVSCDSSETVCSLTIRRKTKLAGVILYQSRVDLHTPTFSLEPPIAAGFSAKPFGLAGPVQLNLAFTPPLNPQAAASYENIIKHCYEYQVASVQELLSGTVTANNNTALAHDIPESQFQENADVVVKPISSHLAVQNWDTAKRTVVIAGDRSTPAVLQLAEKYGIPTLAEPTSGAVGGTSIAYAPLILPFFTGLIEQVIVTGHPTLGRAETALLLRQDIPILAVNEGRPPFALHQHYCQLTAAELESVLKAGSAPADWLELWWEAATVAHRQVANYREEINWQFAEYGIFEPLEFTHIFREELARRSIGASRVSEDGDTAMSGLKSLALRFTSWKDEEEEDIQADSHSILPSPLRFTPLVFLGASNTIRNFHITPEMVSVSVDTETPLAQTIRGMTDSQMRSESPVLVSEMTQAEKQIPKYFANRGLSGIDGTVSTAAGIALSTNQPVRVILGDLTFLHDLTGLLQGDREELPNLQVIVLNDDGGQIFSTLEHGEKRYRQIFTRFFGTPQNVDIEALARGLKCSYRFIRNTDELRQALGEEPKGIEIVEINTHIPNFRERREELVEGIEDALVAELGQIK